MRRSTGICACAGLMSRSGESEPFLCCMCMPAIDRSRSYMVYTCRRLIGLYLIAGSGSRGRTQSGQFSSQNHYKIKILQQKIKILQWKIKILHSKTDEFCGAIRHLSDTSNRTLHQVTHTYMSQVARSSARIIIFFVIVLLENHHCSVEES